MMRKINGALICAEFFVIMITMGCAVNRLNLVENDVLRADPSRCPQLRQLRDPAAARAGDHDRAPVLDLDNARCAAVFLYRHGTVKAVKDRFIV